VRALRLLAHAADERRVVVAELGGGVHGGRALACVRAEEERQGERKRVREARRHTGARFWSSRARGGAWHGGWTRVGHVGRAPVHGGHDVISSNTWRASV